MGFSFRAPGINDDIIERPTDAYSRACEAQVFKTIQRND